ncbi:hypothetical protein I9Y33_002298 [Clostridium perfringens]|nr:hypothetical protein [Clostridium perfringens]EGT0014411.1 hypothetical protein [Clostridium perfringens]
MILKNTELVLYVSEEKDCVYTSNDFKDYLNEKRSSLSLYEINNLKQMFFKMNFSDLKIGKKYTLENLDLSVLKDCEGKDIMFINRFGAFDIMGIDEILQKNKLEYSLTESNNLELSFEVIKFIAETPKKSIVILKNIELN